MERALQLLIHVVTHLMAAGAEFLGIGDFQRRIEPAPEHHAAEEAAQRQQRRG